MADKFECGYCGNRFPFSNLVEHVDLCRVSKFEEMRSIISDPCECAAAALLRPISDTVSPPRATQITEAIWLGNAAGARDESIILANKITAVLNCASDATPLTPAERDALGIQEYHQLDLRDTSDIIANRSKILEGVDKLHRWRRSGHKVFVHCAMGISRSATITIAHLMQYYDMTLLEAMVLVRSRRTVYPNLGFTHILREIAASEASKSATKVGIATATTTATATSSAAGSIEVTAAATTETTSAGAGAMCAPPTPSTSDCDSLTPTSTPASTPSATPTSVKARRRHALLADLHRTMEAGFEWDWDELLNEFPEDGQIPYGALSLHAENLFGC